MDTMGDDILQEMEFKNGNIYDDSDSSLWEEHEMGYGTYSLPGDLEQHTRDNIYIWIS